MQSERSSRIAFAALGAALLAAAPAALGQTSDGPAARGQPSEAPAAEVPLEKLFTLPDSVVTTPSSEPRRGGKTRAEWLARFEQALADLAKAKQGLEDSRKELEEVAPDQAWSMSAPGLPAQATPSETSIDFRLRQQIRKQRDEVERAEHQLDELMVEANLAGVPEDWRPGVAEPGPRVSR